MRVLFSTTAGSGHFGPMVPFAKACRDAGHEVKVAAPASFAEAVAATGLEHAPFADVPPEVLGPIFGRLPELPRVEANRTMIAEVFGRLDARTALPGLTEIMSGWRPDVVVRELCELGSLVAAAKAEVPQVEVAIGFATALAFAPPPPPSLMARPRRAESGSGDSGTPRWPRGKVRHHRHGATRTIHSSTSPSGRWPPGCPRSPACTDRSSTHLPGSASGS